MGVSIPCKDITTQHTANDVAKVRDVVHIRQCTCNKDVPFARNGEAVYTHACCIVCGVCMGMLIVQIKCMSFQTVDAN